MDDEILVKFDNISKKFCRNLKKSLWYGAQDIATEIIGYNERKDRLRSEEFWALKDVSFELRKGKSLGLIGKNGSGKSTILKLINGIMKPDIGCLRVRGRVGALIELGLGFNPILTGRENVYINASVLGISKREIDIKFQSIVEFAELHDFIDTPVHFYSSGMKVRLGFSIIAQLQVDILLVDEVLAVGDLAFRLKCQKAIRKMLANGTSIIFVSHNLEQLLNICDTAIWLNNGQVKEWGSSIEIAQNYERFLMKSSDNKGGYIEFFDQQEKVKINNVELVKSREDEAKEDEVKTFTTNDPIKIRLNVSYYRKHEFLYLRLAFRGQNHSLYYGERIDVSKLFNVLGNYKVEVIVPPKTLLPGFHFFSCGLSKDSSWGTHIHYIEPAAQIVVYENMHRQKAGLVNLEIKLEVFSPTARTNL